MIIFKSTIAVVCILGGTFLLTFFSASSASAHYIEEAKPGQDGYLYPTCHDTSDGNADAIRVGNNYYKGTTPSSSSEIESLEDIAPHGYKQHTNGRATGKNNGVANVSGVDEHFHRSTDRYYKCLLRDVLSITLAIWPSRIIGILLTAYNLVRIYRNRIGGRGGYFVKSLLAVGGMLPIFPTELLARLIFLITDPIEQALKIIVGFF